MAANIQGPTGREFEQIRLEAGRWVLCFDAEYPDPDDISNPAEDFLDWLARSPAHVQAFLESFETYRRLEAVDPDHRIDVEALLRKPPCFPLIG